MPTTATGINEISLVIIPTPDQDRSIEFYENLGFEKRTDVAFGGRYRWVEVYPPSGTTGIALAPPREGDAVGVQPAIRRTSDDTDATHAELAARGVEVEGEARGRAARVPPMFWSRDPAGNALMIVQPS